MKRIDLCQFHVGSHSETWSCHDDAGGYPKTNTAGEEKHQLDQEEADGVEPILTGRRPWRRQGLAGAYLAMT